MKTIKRNVGDHVRLHEAMGVDGYNDKGVRDGFITRIDGGDIYIKLIIDGKIVEVHRYADEFEVITPITIQSRPMKSIPISAAERIAKDYGYDQVVIMARRVSNPLPPLNPATARPDDGISGEHITTYGIDPTHCSIAALMGNILKDIARWPEKEDFDKARALLSDLENGTFDYSDYEQTGAGLAALDRILEKRA